MATTSLVILCQGQPVKIFFREDWKESEAALPVTQEHVSGAGLRLLLYGPGRSGIKKSNHLEIANDPFYIWSGECAENWALALRYESKAVDLSGPEASVVFRSRQSGFRRLHIIVRSADGTWLVSEQSQPATEQWAETNFKVRDLRWRKLDIGRVVESSPIETPDLTRVVEIGFTDLMRGGGTPASSRLDWIEVYGKPIDLPQ